MTEWWKLVMVKRQKLGLNRTFTHLGRAFGHVAKWHVSSGKSHQHNHDAACLRASEYSSVAMPEWWIQTSFSCGTSFLGHTTTAMVSHFQEELWQAG